MVTIYQTKLLSPICFNSCPAFRTAKTQLDVTSCENSTFDDCHNYISTT